MKSLLIAIVLFVAFPVDAQTKCDKVRCKTDKFTYEKTCSYHGEIVTIMRIAKGNKIKYYMLLSVPAPNPTYGKGAFVMFENGERINGKYYPTETKVVGTNFRATAIFQLSRKQVYLLQDQKITDVKVYAFTERIPEDEAEQIKAAVICMPTL